MRNRIVKALVFTALVLSMALPAHAQMFQTHLKLVIEAPTNTSKVSEDLIAEDGTYSGTVESRDTYTDEQGMSVTETVTTFTNKNGELMLSADVAITARSEAFTATAGESFSEDVSVDVTLDLEDPDYYLYLYSMDVEGLPEWLEVSGDIASDDYLDPGITSHHHGLKLSGTPGFTRLCPLTMRSYVLSRPLMSSDFTVRISCRTLAAP